MRNNNMYIHLYNCKFLYEFLLIFFVGITVKQIYLNIFISQNILENILNIDLVIPVL